MNDVVFENRNQSYGAYALRHQYDSIMSRSIFFALLFFVSMVSYPLLHNYFNTSMATAEDLHIIPVVILENTQPIEKIKTVYIPPKQILPPSKPQIKFVPPTVVRDESSLEESDIPTIDSLKTKIIGTTTIDTITTAIGSGNAIDMTPIYEEITGSNETEVFNSYAVQQQPEFPNGLAAMYSFLRKHLKYPREATEQGLKGTVFIQFVVSVDGTISDAKILKGIGAGLDEEALRVVKLMPPWKPGKHNGKPVPVIFVLPIKFEII